MRKFAPAELLTIVIVGLLLVGVLFSAIAHMERGTVRFEVQGRERVLSDKGNRVESKYLVFTNRETFEVTDSLLEWRFNSSDTYGRLEEGKCFVGEAYGWRVPLLSMYRNLVKVEEITCQASRESF